MSTQRKNNEYQHVFTRQATILRKNLMEWDYMLRTPKGETWPTMVRMSCYYRCGRMHPLCCLLIRIIVAANFARHIQQHTRPYMM